jgi:hypothetical protein
MKSAAASHPLKRTNTNSSTKIERQNMKDYDVGKWGGEAMLYPENRALKIIAQPL